MEANRPRTSMPRRLAAAFRGGAAALSIAAALGAAGCVVSAGGASHGGFPARDGEQARCERDRGVWRPLIADGYCEIG